MLELLQAIPFSFAALFPIVNPPGSAIVFLSLIKNSPIEEVHKLATKVAVYMSVLLIIVLITGSWILHIFGVTIPIVLVSGGLLLTHIGWQVLNQANDVPDDPTKSKENADNLIKSMDAMAFYPLTLPITAGPACIAVTITIGAHSMGSPTSHSDFMSLVGYSIGIILVALSVFFCYRYSHILMTKMKANSRNVMMCLTGFINICMGLQITWRGLSLLIPK